MQNVDQAAVRSPEANLIYGPLVGLSEEEAARRLTAEGYNELPSAKPRSLLAIAWEVLHEPMLLLLVGAGIIYLILGDFEEAILLLASSFVVIGITLYQEQRTERALDALRDLSSPRALVIRDGIRRRVAGREVARGDLVVLAEGDRVPADGVVRSCTNLSVDESLLTGESVPVRKIQAEAEQAMERPGGDDLPSVYSGTLIVQGQGIAEIQGTGAHTELGRIGKALRTVESEQTRLQRETGKLVRVLAIAGLSLCALVAVAYSLTRGNVLDGLLAGITLAMSMIPEEFPVVLTVFLAFGAWRIARQRVLTRRMPALETLGAATVLCVDKTGTLTRNQMAVQRVLAGTAAYNASETRQDVAPEVQRLAQTAALASDEHPFDPMERAIHDLAYQIGSPTSTDLQLVHVYPLSPSLLAVVHVWTSSNEPYLVAAKGAPEAVADLCRMDKGDRRRADEQVRAMAQEGLRVLGVAKAEWTGDMPENQRDFAFEFVGLLGLADPVRPGVADAVHECQSAGIRVVMITGDYPVTAQSIGRQIGLASVADVFTGPELDRMDDEELRQRIESVSIFARVVPEQKLRLVKALKANGEVVAMTGDGVNDAPALQAANIGVAMGGRGTDVAREASSLVVLDDNFTSIVYAIRLGRRIYDNLSKAMAFVLAMHVPIAGISLVPVLFKLPLVLLPVHIVFLEMIIDPACSLAFEAEPEEANVMNRPPRDPKEPLFSRRLLLTSVAQGASVLGVVLAVFLIAQLVGQSEGEIRALTFTTLVVASLALILSDRSWSRTILATLRTPNAALGWIAGGAVVFLGLVLFVPFLRDLFRFNVLHANDLVITVAAGFLSVLWFEVLKFMRNRPRLLPLEKEQRPADESIGRSGRQV
jgi:P-type Ca2+ transporter type 2C